MRKLGLSVFVFVAFLGILTDCSGSRSAGPGKSYTTINDNGVEAEFSFITKEQFDRICISNENSATSVNVTFYDTTELTLNKVIKGTRPKYYGMSYHYIKYNPPYPNLLAYLRYRNGDKCYMNILFYDKNFSDTISLANNRSEYTRQYNLYADMVKNAK